MFVVLMFCLLCRYTKDWNIPLGVAFPVYGWGHNHRGQLGGVEGNKIKTPRLCDAFSELSPVKVVGGEQTMFAITQDGKVFLFSSSLHLLHLHLIFTHLISLPLHPGLCLRLWCVRETRNRWCGERVYPYSTYLISHKR